MIIFLTVLCFSLSFFVWIKFCEINSKLNSLSENQAKDFDIITKYLLKLPTEEQLRFYSEIQSDRFNKIIKQIEDSKEVKTQFVRSKDSFKSLQKAFSNQPVEMADV